MLSIKEYENINRSILVCFYTRGSDFFCFQKGAKRNVKRQNNRRNYDGRNRREAKRRKLLFYRAACAMLCLLIASVIFGVAHFLKDGKEPALPVEESTKPGKDISRVADDQSEKVLPFSEPAVSDQAGTISTDITAANAILVNKDTNTVLYQKNGTDKIAPASTAKMITALTVLDHCSPEDEMRVGAEIEMIHNDSSTAWLMQGDTLTVRQLLIALMLPSGNDAAYTLAPNTGKAIADDNSLTNQQAIKIFMDKVNEKAREIGATDSNFVVPDGYDAEGQYTTAYDLAIIAKACLENSIISEIVASNTSNEKWPNGREVTYKNSNKLLDPNSPYYHPEVIGLKTGTSSLGGACVVSAAVIDGETYICVVMGSTKESRFQDSVDILDKIKAQ